MTAQPPTRAAPTFPASVMAGPPVGAPTMPPSSIASAPSVRLLQDSSPPSNQAAASVLGLLSSPTAYSVPSPNSVAVGTLPVGYSASSVSVMQSAPAMQPATATYVQ